MEDIILGPNANWGEFLTLCGHDTKHDFFQDNQVIADGVDFGQDGGNGQKRERASEVDETSQIPQRRSDSDQDETADEDVFCMCGGRNLSEDNSFDESTIEDGLFFDNINEFWKDIGNTLHPRRTFWGAAALAGDEWRGEVADPLELHLLPALNEDEALARQSPSTPPPRQSSDPPLARQSPDSPPVTPADEPSQYRRVGELGTPGSAGGGAARMDLSGGNPGDQLLNNWNTRITFNRRRSSVPVTWPEECPFMGKRSRAGVVAPHPKIAVYKNMLEGIRKWDAMILAIRSATDPGTKEFHTKLYFINEINKQIKGNKNVLKFSFETIEPLSRARYKHLTDPEGRIEDFYGKYTMRFNLLSSFYKTIIKEICDKIPRTPQYDFKYGDLEYVYKEIVRYMNLGWGEKMGSMSLRIDTFIERNWKQMMSIEQVMGFLAGKEGGNYTKEDFIQRYWKTKGKITLTDDQMDDVKTLEIKVMNWWTEKIVPDATPTWASKLHANMTLGKSTDKQLWFPSNTSSVVDSAAKTLADITKGNAFVIKHATRSNPPDQPFQDKLQKIHAAALGRGAVANNASQCPYYDGSRPPGINIFSGIVGSWPNGKPYNCNNVNVADPMPVCPRRSSMWSSRNEVFVKNNLDQTLLEFKIIQDGNSSSKFLVTFKLKGEGGGEDIIPIVGRRTSADEAAKSSVIKKVWDVMRVNTGSGFASANDALKNFISTSPPAVLDEIVKEFTMKLLGDLGQELYSVSQTNTGPTVHMGMDRPSFIRACWLLSNKRNPGQYAWWFAYLAKRDYYILKSPSLSGGAPRIENTRRRNTRRRNTRRRNTRRRNTRGRNTRRKNTRGRNTRGRNTRRKRHSKRK